MSAASAELAAAAAAVDQATEQIEAVLAYFGEVWPAACPRGHSMAPLDPRLILLSVLIWRFAYKTCTAPLVCEYRDGPSAERLGAGWGGRGQGSRGVRDALLADRLAREGLRALTELQ